MEQSQKISGLAVAIGVTSDLAFAACVTFINFAKYHETKNVTFYLYSDKQLDSFVSPLRDLGLNVTAVRYEPKVPKKFLWGSKSVAYFSPLVLSKFEAFTLIKHHEEVIWLDYDITIISPFEEVLGNRTADISFVPGGKFEDNFLRKDNLPPDLIGSAGMSAGFIHLTNGTPQSSEVLSDLYLTYQNNFDNLYMPEQGIFGLVLSRQKISIRHLDSIAYCSDVRNKSLVGVRVVHSYGKKKFWTGVHSSEWMEHYATWLSLGGSPFSRAAHFFTKSRRKLIWFLYKGKKLIEISKGIF